MCLDICKRLRFNLKEDVVTRTYLKQSKPKGRNKFIFLFEHCELDDFNKMKMTADIPK